MIRYAFLLLALVGLAAPSAKADEYVLARQYLNGAVVRVVAVRVLPMAPVAQQSGFCGCRTGAGCSCPLGQCDCGPDCPCGQATAAAARQQRTAYSADCGPDCPCWQAPAAARQQAAASYSSLPVVRYSAPVQTYSYQAPVTYAAPAVRYSAPTYYSTPTYYSQPSFGGYSSFGGSGASYYGGFSSFGGGGNCPGGVCR